MAAAQIFNTLGKLGIGLTVAGGIVNSALYNGKFRTYTIDTVVS